MRQFEFEIKDKIFNTALPIGDAKWRWFNSLGAEGWEIVEIKSAYNADRTELQLFVTLCRELP